MRNGKPTLLIALAALVAPLTARAEPQVVSVSTGTIHTCAVQEGSLWCWGQNGRGQLGDGSTFDALTPRWVSSLGSGVVASVTSGAHHSCAVKLDGSLWCWGYNGNGQLGDGTLTERHAPVQVSALGSEVLEVAAGWSHTCARKADGSLWCWGSNSDGRLGDGTTIGKPLPTLVSTLADVSQVSAGVSHTCALKTDGSLWCWGDNRLGALGDFTNQSRSLPVQVAALGDQVQEVSTGAHTCARKSNGSLWCWGWNFYGQLGDGSTANRFEPNEVAALLGGVTGVSAGWRHTCALKTDGTLRCWGLNAKGQLGDGSNARRPFPVLASLGPGVTEASAGEDHTCARKSGGRLWCTGFGQYGQLGLGNGFDRNTFGELSPIAPPAAAVPAVDLRVLLLLALLLPVGAFARRLARRAPLDA